MVSPQALLLAIQDVEKSKQLEKFTIHDKIWNSQSKHYHLSLRYS